MTRVPGPCRHKCTHRPFHITYRPSDNTQTDIHTLPSRPPSQLFEHSCQNSETSNTTIVREPEKSAKNPKHTNSCWSDTYGRLKCSKPALRRLDPCSSCHIFFSPVLPRSHYSPLLCLIPFLSTSQSNLFLFFFSSCPRRSPLLSRISSHNSSAKTSLHLAPHMWVHTAKSRNNTEILQIRSCQINGGISGAHPSLWRGQLEACSRPNLHVKTHSAIQAVD